MSVVTVQLGQCGNQIGSQFFSAVANDLHSSPNSRLFGDYDDECVDRFFSVDDRGKWTARAVMVDTEPKVIAQTAAEARRSGIWKYANRSDVCERRGSGNNWACGYCVHGRRAAGPTLEAVRRAVESCDHFAGFVAHMSLAGGTGSGLGSYLTRRLRDDYPHCFIVNQVIWPYSAGEVIVQNYNAILSLAHLYQSADVVFAVENDAVHGICTRLLAIPKVSFSDINRVIARQLALSVVPACPPNSSSLIHSHIGDMLEQLVAHPAYKLVTIRSIPHVSDRSVDYTSYQWPALLRHLRQMLIANATMEEGINWQVKTHSEDRSRSLSNHLILRGKDVDSADPSAFRDPSIYSRQSSSLGCRVSVWTHGRSFGQREKTAVLLSNGQSSVIDSLDCTVGRAWNMFASRAYLHQYTHRGLEENDFVDCFAALEQILADYRQLSAV